jgi:hypothetical protein
MLTQHHRLGAADVGSLQAVEVAELFLSPHFDHLTRIAAAVAALEAEVATDVPTVMHAPLMLMMRPHRWTGGPTVH